MRFIRWHNEMHSVLPAQIVAQQHLACSAEGLSWCGKTHPLAAETLTDRRCAWVLAPNVTRGAGLAAGGHAAALAPLELRLSEHLIPCETALKEFVMPAAIAR